MAPAAELALGPCSHSLRLLPAAQVREAAERHLQGIQAEAQASLGKLQAAAAALQGQLQAELKHSDELGDEMAKLRAAAAAASVSQR